MTTLTRKRYRIKCICEACWGFGYQATRTGKVPCAECGGTGEVEKWINEEVVDE